MTADLLGHLAYAFIAFGQLQLAKRNPIGWPLRLIGELGWVGLGLHLGMTSIWMWGLVFCSVDLLGMVHARWLQVSSDRRVARP